jgi:hypothetical protein
MFMYVCWWLRSETAVQAGALRARLWQALLL